MFQFLSRDIRKFSLGHICSLRISRATDIDAFDARITHTSNVFVPLGDAGANLRSLGSYICPTLWHDKQDYTHWWYTSWNSQSSGVNLNLFHKNKNYYLTKAWPFSKFKGSVLWFYFWDVQKMTDSMSKNHFQKFQLSLHLLGQKIPIQNRSHVSRTSFNVFFLLWSPLKAGLNTEWTVAHSNMLYIDSNNKKFPPGF